MFSLVGSNSVITCLKISPTNHLISGHENGSIRVWNLTSKECMTTFHGHNNRINALSFNADGTKLVSAANDTDIIIWDMVDCRGLFRLKGHHQPVMDVRFITFGNDGDSDGTQEMIISASKDTSLKLWHLQTQHCLQTIVGHKSEVWTFDISKDGKYLMSAGLDSEVHVWKIEPYSPEIMDNSQNSKENDENSDTSDDESTIVVSSVSSIRIRSLGVVSFGAHMGKNTRIVDIRFNSRNDLLIAQTNSSLIQLFYVHSQKECKLSMKFRKQKIKNQLTKKYPTFMAKYESIDQMLLQTESGEWMDEYLQSPTIDQNNLLLLINSLRNFNLEARDLLVSLSPIRTKHRIHSMDISKQPIFLSSLTSNLNIINAIKGDTNINKHAKKRSATLNMSSIASEIDMKENEEQFEKLFIANDDQMKISQMKQSLLSNDLQAEDVLLLEILLAYSNNKLSIIHIPIPSLDFDYISDPLSVNIDSDDDIKIEDKEQKRKKRREHLRVLDWNTKFICNYIEINDISSKYGHRTAVRAVVFSSDDLMIASVSKNELKIWNTRTFQCIRNFDCEYGLQCMFAPGNKHIIIATKQGNLLLYDLISNELIQKQIAHDGSIYALDAIPDQNGIISGGSDTCLKIWQFTLKIEMQTNSKKTIANANGVKQLFLQLKTTVKLQDEILAIKYSSDQKYLAIALLDNTIQIYFADSMKFYLRLYGHKLPVTCVDISSDNTLLISGSADKNIKIWGLKFGDCLRSIFAHRETVMQVRFVPNTHYFYSCSRDKSIKYWDGDKFKKIQELHGHCQEVWCLALNSTGQLLLSSGGDRSLRLWLETSSLLFSLEEEQKEFETLLDTNENNDEQHPTAIKGSGLISDGILQSRRASKKTMNIIERGERLIDDLQLADKEMKKRNELQMQNDNYNLHAKMYGYESIEEYMFEQIIAIPSSDLEEVLRIIPYEFLPSLFHFMQSFVNNGRNIEKITRCVLFLVKYHASQLKAQPDMHSVLKRLKIDMKLRLKEYQNRIGFNLQAMFYMQNLMQTKAEYYLEADRYKHVKLSQKDIFQTWADEDDDENLIIVD